MKTEKHAKIIVKGGNGLSLCIDQNGYLFTCSKNQNGQYSRATKDGMIVTSFDLDYIAIGARNNDVQLYILSGEGEQGNWSKCNVKTLSAFKRCIKKEKSNGDRWAYGFYVSDYFDDSLGRNVVLVDVENSENIRYLPESCFKSI